VDEKCGADRGDQQHLVSVRQLSIRPEARIALRNGIRLLQKNDLPAGMAHLQYAIALSPEYYEAYYVVGVANLMMGREQEAEQAFQQSIELSEGRYARPLMALGAMLCDQRRFSEAAFTIRKGLDLDDTPWIGHYALAQALFSLGRWDEAEENAHAAIRRQPEISDTYLLLANIHMRQKNTVAVINDLDEFLKLESDSTIRAQARKLREDLWPQYQSGK
jgi:tetratricopeptide (TPR) repeat protein